MSAIVRPGEDQADGDHDDRLARSRQYCTQLTRSAAKNFYYGLRLLPEPKRSGMFALYAYMRLADDIADEYGRSIEQREHDLERWRLQTHAALRGEPDDDPGHDIWPALTDLVTRCRIPTEIFDEVISGQRQDLRPVQPDTFEQLHKYCYRVAGVVGLASIRVWGYEGGADTEALAVARGVAFQLTNILRDVREDASRGRVYLPREDLAAMGMTEQDLLAGRRHPRLLELLRFQIARAERFFETSRPLEARISRDSRSTLSAMTEIYRGLLRKIAAEPLRVLRQRVSLSLFTKVRIGWRAARAAKGTADVV
ncbi:MAG TPA: phytoene/squalene synthase family protein [Tepidisphaeraceae bacterium]|jgi:phytoene synthase